ncbi:MAG: hypothetical protein E7104_00090 [Prevotella sp.]|jgi:YD repeat-containing protein|nr:hypothetical protein [Prevotella sp.]
MMKKIKNIIVLLLFSMLSFLAHGQELPYKMPTPTASNLGKFGIIPVSMYTGKADISIPIYQMKERGITLDINLRYDTSGLLVNQLPGWTGHGWSLMAGGSITRKTNGMDDELDPKEQSLNKWHNYFEVHDKIPEYLNQLKQESNRIPIFTDIYADVFYFDFMGHHGKFWLGADGEWKVQSDDNICVEFDYHDENNFIYPFIANRPQSSYKNPKTIKGFTLITDDGTRYTFGGDASSIEYVTDLSVNFDREWFYDWTANTWMLTSVDDRFGNNLYKFKYSRGKFITQLYKTRTGLLTQAEYSSFFYSYSSQHGVSIHTEYSGTLNSPVYLTAIYGASGTSAYFVRKSAFPNSIASHELYPSLYKSEGASADLSDRFFPEASNPKYNAIYNPVYFQYYLQCTTDNELKDYQAHRDVDKYDDPFSSMDIEILKEIVLLKNGTIFNCNLNYEMKNRIHLTSVDFKAASNNLKTYTMKYNSYDMVPKDYLTEAVDYWGYYNGLQYASADKNTFEPSQSSTMCGMLTQITYPTGGYTKIKYQLNSYSKYINADRKSFTTLSRPENAGGLRVSEISNYEGGIPKEIREYKYEFSPGVSSGVLYSLPQRYCKWTDNYSSDHRVAYRFGTSSIIPLSNSFGSFIGYSKVKELNADNTYKIHTFSDATQVYDDPYEYTIMSCEGANPYNKFSERGYLLGKQLSETTFNSKGEKLYETTFKYSTDKTFNTNHYTLTTNFGVFAGCCYGNIYKLYYPKIKLEETVTKEYIGNACLEEKHKYNYEDKVNDYYSSSKKLFKTDVKVLSSEIHQRGKDSIKTVYGYPFSGFEYKLASQFCLPAISSKSYLNGELFKGNKTIYGLCKGQIVPQKEIQYLNNENDYDVIAEYKAYNSKFLPKEIINKEGINNKLFWSSSDQLVAIVANGSDNIKLYPSPSSARNLLVSSKEGEVFGDLPTKIDVCTYNSKGLVHNSATGNGIETKYKYDRIGRLTEIHDSNDNIIERYSYNYVSSDSGSSKTENFGIYPCYEPSGDISKCDEVYPAKIRLCEYHGIDSCLVLAYNIHPDAVSPEIRIKRKRTGITEMTIPLPNNKLFGHRHLRFPCWEGDECEVVLYENGEQIDKATFTTSNTRKYYADVVNDFINKTAAIYIWADESSGNVTTFLNIYKDFRGDFMKTPYVCHGIIRPGHYINSYYSEPYSKWEKGRYSVYIIREDTSKHKLVEVLAYGGGFSVE